MKAVLFDGSLRLVSDYPRPLLKPDWAVIKVIKAGICRTDIELIKGYMGFKGILGHEFIGVIEDTIDKSLIGRRVTGEINGWMCRMYLRWYGE
ncbi:MAG: alcohol dehydrogenase catalytic domain-containing protein [Nitrospirae bacterium]|nr:alcohol dehydrogenase catalytic domain-containing protein [Nitrospirota bacterium]